MRTLVAVAVFGMLIAQRAVGADRRDNDASRIFRRLDMSIASAMAEVKAIEEHWDISDYSLFLQSSYMTSASWDMMKLRFMHKIIAANILAPPNVVSPFVIAFLGSSVTAGHDSMFSDSFPVLVGKHMRAALAEANVRLESRNDGLGNNPCFPYAACVKTFAGTEPDVIHWEQTYDCLSAHGWCYERFIREATLLPQLPLLVFDNSATAHWDENTCGPEELDIGSRAKEKELYGDYQDGSALLERIHGAFDEQRRVVEEGRAGQPDESSSSSAESAGTSYKDEKTRSAVGMRRIVTEKNVIVKTIFFTLESVAPKYAGVGIQLFAHEFEQAPYACKGPFEKKWMSGNYAWHPSKLGHALRAAHLALTWLHCWIDAVEETKAKLLLLQDPHTQSLFTTATAQLQQVEEEKEDNKEEEENGTHKRMADASVYGDLAAALQLDSLPAASMAYSTEVKPFLGLGAGVRDDSHPFSSFSASDGRKGRRSLAQHSGSSSDSNSDSTTSSSSNSKSSGNKKTLGLDLLETFPHAHYLYDLLREQYRRVYTAHQTDRVTSSLSSQGNGGSLLQSNPVVFEDNVQCFADFEPRPVHHSMERHVRYAEKVRLLGSGGGVGGGSAQHHPHGRHAHQHAVHAAASAALASRSSSSSFSQRRRTLRAESADPVEPAPAVEPDQNRAAGQLSSYHATGTDVDVSQRRAMSATAVSNNRNNSSSDIVVFGSERESGTNEGLVELPYAQFYFFNPRLPDGSLSIEGGSIKNLIVAREKTGLPGAWKYVIFEDLLMRSIVLRAKARGYRDYKHVLTVGPHGGALALRISPKKDGRILICRPRGAVFGDGPPKGYSDLNGASKPDVFLNLHSDVDSMIAKMHSMGASDLSNGGSLVNISSVFRRDTAVRLDIVDLNDNDMKYCKQLRPNISESVGAVPLGEWSWFAEASSSGAAGKGSMKEPLREPLVPVGTHILTLVPRGQQNFLFSHLLTQ